MPESDRYRQHLPDLVVRIADIAWRVSSLERAILLSSLPILPAGSITLFAGPSSNVPTGWLVCDGSAVNRVTYNKLFANIGTTWGAGDGSTTFNLPDLRDRYPVGQGANNVGVTGGSATSSSSGDHAHTQADIGASGSHTHSIPQGSDQTSSVGGTATFTVSHQSHTHGGTNSNTHTHTTPDTDSAGTHSHSTTPPFATLVPIIRY